jgi:hypothetical protein
VIAAIRFESGRGKGLTDLNEKISDSLRLADLMVAKIQR